jgi:hypothetical protein
MGFGLLTHGQEKTETLNVGGVTVYKHKIYCQECGWYDVFQIGGTDKFWKRHGRCGDRPPITRGAAVKAIGAIA